MTNKTFSEDRFKNKHYVNEADLYHFMKLENINYDVSFKLNEIDNVLLKFSVNSFENKVIEFVDTIYTYSSENGEKLYNTIIDFVRENYNNTNVPNLMLEDVGNIAAIQEFLDKFMTEKDLELKKEAKTIKTSIRKVNSETIISDKDLEKLPEIKTLLINGKTRFIETAPADNKQKPFDKDSDVLDGLEGFKTGSGFYPYDGYFDPPCEFDSCVIAVKKPVNIPNAQMSDVKPQELATVLQLKQMIKDELYDKSLSFDELKEKISKRAYFIKFAFDKALNDLLFHEEIALDRSKYVNVSDECKYDDNNDLEKDTPEMLEKLSEIKSVLMAGRSVADNGDQEQAPIVNDKKPFDKDLFSELLDNGEKIDGVEAVILDGMVHDFIQKNKDDIFGSKDYAINEKHSAFRRAGQSSQYIKNYNEYVRYNKSLLNEKKELFKNIKSLIMNSIGQYGPMSSKIDTIKFVTKVFGVKSDIVELFIDNAIRSGILDITSDDLICFGKKYVTKTDHSHLGVNTEKLFGEKINCIDSKNSSANGFIKDNNIFILNSLKEQIEKIQSELDSVKHKCSELS